MQLPPGMLAHILAMMMPGNQAVLNAPPAPMQTGSMTGGNQAPNPMPGLSPDVGGSRFGGNPSKSPNGRGGTNRMADTGMHDSEGSSDAEDTLEGTEGEMANVHKAIMSRPNKLTKRIPQMKGRARG